MTGDQASSDSALQKSYLALCLQPPAHSDAFLDPASVWRAGGRGGANTWGEGPAPGWGREVRDIIQGDCCQEAILPVFSFSHGWKYTAGKLACERRWFPL